MDSLISTFHIDWKLIIAQAVNFIIVLVVLKKFAYGPIVSVLEKRTKSIEDGLRNAEEAQKKLEESEVKKEEVIAEARKKSQEIIVAAEEQGKKLRDELKLASEQEAEKIIASAKSKIDADRDAMMREIKSQAAELITIAVEKVLDKKLNKEADSELIKTAIEEHK